MGEAAVNLEERNLSDTVLSTNRRLFALLGIDEGGEGWIFKGDWGWLWKVPGAFRKEIRIARLNKQNIRLAQFNLSCRVMTDNFFLV